MSSKRNVIWNNKVSYDMISEGTIKHLRRFVPSALLLYKYKNIILRQKKMGESEFRTNILKYQ